MSIASVQISRLCARICDKATGLKRSFELLTELQPLTKSGSIMYKDVSARENTKALLLDVWRYSLLQVDRVSNRQKVLLFQLIISIINRPEFDIEFLDLAEDGTARCPSNVLENASGYRKLFYRTFSYAFERLVRGGLYESLAWFGSQMLAIAYFRVPGVGDAMQLVLSRLIEDEEWNFEGDRYGRLGEQLKRELKVVRRAANEHDTFDKPVRRDWWKFHTTVPPQISDGIAAGEKFPKLRQKMSETSNKLLPFFIVHFITQIDRVFHHGGLHLHTGGLSASRPLFDSVGRLEGAALQRQVLVRAFIPKKNVNETVCSCVTRSRTFSMCFQILLCWIRDDCRRIEAEVLEQEPGGGTDAPAFRPSVALCANRMICVWPDALSVLLKGLFVSTNPWVPRSVTAALNILGTWFSMLPHILKLHTQTETEEADHRGPLVMIPEKPAHALVEDSGDVKGASQMLTSLDDNAESAGPSSADSDLERIESLRKKLGDSGIEPPIGFQRSESFDDVSDLLGFDAVPSPEVGMGSTAYKIMDEDSGDSYSSRLPPSFPFQFFLQSLRLLLESEHFEVLQSTLAFLYHYVEILPLQFRIRVFNAMLLSKPNFVKFFCHWQADVRYFFMQLLLFKAVTTSTMGAGPSEADATKKDSRRGRAQTVAEDDWDSDEDSADDKDALRPARHSLQHERRLPPSTPPMSPAKPRRSLQFERSANGFLDGSETASVYGDDQDELMANRSIAARRDLLVSWLLGLDGEDIMLHLISSQRPFLKPALDEYQSTVAEFAEWRTSVVRAREREKAPTFGKSLRRLFHLDPEPEPQKEEQAIHHTLQSRFTRRIRADIFDFKFK